MKILDLSDSNILRMVLFNRISWFSPTESIKNWFSPTQSSPEWFCYEYSETYKYGALYISLSFSGCYFLGRMRAEWFCSTESFCRIFLAESFCCADWVSRMILLIQSAQQNDSAKNILQTDSVKQNHSADWFCQAESFCRVILSSRIILLLFSPKK